MPCETTMPFTNIRSQNPIIAVMRCVKSVPCELGYRLPEHCLFSKTAIPPVLNFTYMRKNRQVPENQFNFSTASLKLKLVSTQNKPLTSDSSNF